MDVEVMQYVGKILIVVGIVSIIAGIVIYLAGDKLSWLGHLPGDIRIERENFKFYFPITTMIVVSVLLSLLIRFIQKFF